MISNNQLENDGWDRSARHPDISDQDLAVEKVRTQATVSCKLALMDDLDLSALGLFKKSQPRQDLCHFISLAWRGYLCREEISAKRFHTEQTGLERWQKSRYERPSAYFLGPALGRRQGRIAFNLEHSDSTPTLSPLPPAPEHSGFPQTWPMVGAELCPQKRECLTS